MAMDWLELVGAELPFMPMDLVAGAVFIETLLSSAALHPGQPNQTTNKMKTLLLSTALAQANQDIESKW
jgi:hypothetical protein